MAASVGQDPLEQMLGYNPWEFKLINPRRDLAYVVIGCAVYEAIDSFNILVQARAKWNSLIYLTLSASLLFGTTSTILAFVFQTSEKHASDAFVGHEEYALASIGSMCVLAARLFYYYATLRVTLAVFPGNKYVIYPIVGITILAAAGHLWYSISLVRYFTMAHDEYVMYIMSDYDVTALFGGITSVLVPFLPEIQISQAFQGITTFIFMLFTKVPFLWEIFRKLRVPIREAIETMGRLQSARRILYCCAWSVAEVVLMSTMGMTDLAFCVAVFSTMFQITTMVMLAFHGSVAIIEAHSMASRSRVPKSQASGRALVSGQGLTPAANTSQK